MHHAAFFYDRLFYEWFPFSWTSIFSLGLSCFPLLVAFSLLPPQVLIISSSKYASILTTFSGRTKPMHCNRICNSVSILSSNTTLGIGRLKIPFSVLIPLSGGKIGNVLTRDKQVHNAVFFLRSPSESRLSFQIEFQFHTFRLSFQFQSSVFSLQSF